MGAYSYTTVTVEPDGSARITVHMHPDDSLSVLCGSGRDRAQISFTHAGADVIITPTDPNSPTAGDVQVARQLAESFATYAAEVERLHALITNTAA
ncbi:hypothetical protein GCM10009527_018460 [Actinomadura nitritigenes]|uniref:DUF1876 domain-containing protein n=1 Tax=Actinomadura nitritigenes TaxID=134602 RepID=A0ABS3RAK8_9ACTN|nr:hypothetical protein [Actinomadura nitritigenes]MBO2443265.1 hypothetical protein [Actinomadura nitritigenes]